MSVFQRVVLTPLARADIQAILDPDVRAAIVDALVEIERDLEFGKLLESREYTGDLRGCRKVYVDKPGDDKPRYRIVYWCSPSERSPRRARILAVGLRAGAQIYRQAAHRYNADRAAAQQSPVEDMSDEDLGLTPE